jgi:hypothetical protein
MLADITDLSSLPANLRQGAQRLVLLRTAARHSPRDLPLQALVDRARALMPALRGWLPVRIDGQVHLHSFVQSEVHGPSQLNCLSPVREVPAGAVAREDDFQAVSCGSRRPVRAFNFDRSSQTARTSRAIAPSEVVLRYAGFGEGGVAFGDRVTLLVVSGPFRIERSVEAAQSAHGRNRVFVRTGEGEVFAVPVGSESR